ncbi:MAG: diaminopimelate epimerase [Planctomycetota bacterium]
MDHVRFVKMEGAGNDYVLVDLFAESLAEGRGPELARIWSNRHFGIGSDGLILLAPSERADCRMLMWNADGSRGAMCGNGLRCVAKLASTRGRVPRPLMTIECDSGVVRAECLSSAEAEPGLVAVSLEAVTVAEVPSEITLDGRTWGYFPASAGNPHAVIFVDEALDALPVAAVGTALQGAPEFPDGVNVEFVRPVGDGQLAQRIWERGSGETMACGSGATVAAVAALRHGRVVGPSVAVRSPGGEVRVRSSETGLVLEGPARTVFSGEVPLPAPSSGAARDFR